MFCLQFVGYVFMFVCKIVQAKRLVFMKFCTVLLQFELISTLFLCTGNPNMTVSKECHNLVDAFYMWARAY